jgi:hypothetical protein
VRMNMLATGDTFTPVPNSGIPDNIQTVHDAGVVFNDAMTKLIGGVYSGNQTSIVNDLNATKTGLQNAIATQNLTGQALHNVEKLMTLVGNEAALVASVDTANPTQASAVNGQIGHVQSQILNVVNHDATLAALAVGADGTTGFAALPPTSTPGDHGGHHDLTAGLHHFGHMWG